MQRVAFSLSHTPLNSMVAPELSLNGHVCAIRNNGVEEGGSTRVDRQLPKQPVFMGREGLRL